MTYARPARQANRDLSAARRTAGREIQFLPDAAPSLLHGFASTCGLTIRCSAAENIPHLFGSVQHASAWGAVPSCPASVQLQTKGEEAEGGGDSEGEREDAARVEPAPVGGRW
jgi:hypothetical protein